MSSRGVPPVPEKKGTSPWVWVGVGCLGVLVVGGIVATLAGMFLVGKARDMAREMEEDPIAASSRLIAAANPEIELVEADKDSKVVTFRNTETGEEFTVSYEDIEEGRFTFTSGGETAELDFDAGEGDEARMTITTEGGTQTYSAGAELEDLPAWVPVYPSTTPQGSFASETPEMRSGGYTFETNDSLDAVVEFYVSELESAGLAIRSRTTTPQGAMLVAGSEGDARGATLTASSDEGRVEGLLNFMEKR